MNLFCKKYNNLLTAYLDRELTERQTARVEKHIQGCDLCREQLRQLQAAADILTLWEPVSPSADYDMRFWKKIENLKAHTEAAPGKPSFLQTVRQWMEQRTLVTASAAAAVIVCLCSIALFFSNSHKMPALDLSAQQNMELYLNMDVIAKTDALQHFEVIQLLDVLEQELDG